MNHSTQPTASESTEAHERSAGPAWLVVLTREVIVKLRDKAFVLSTVFTVLGIVGFAVFTAVLAQRTTTHTVATTDPAATAVVELAQQHAGERDDVQPREVSAAQATQLVDRGEADAALTRTDHGWELTGRTGVDPALSRTIESAASEWTLTDNAQAVGTDVTTLREGSQLSVRTLSDQPDRGPLTFVLGFVFAMLFYVAAIVFGMAIANSVLEEKQNRVVEILATAIPVRHILYGKVAGNCLLAYAQLVLYAAVGLLVANLTGHAAVLGGVIPASGWFIAFFVVGFAAQACIWAVLGSLASRSEDLQSNTGPILGVLVLALMVGIFAKGVWLTVASYVPIVSSVAMPVRLLRAEAQWWEPVLSLGVCALFGWLMFRVGERIYQRAVFHGGQALTWRRALKLEA